MLGCSSILHMLCLIISSLAGMAQFLFCCKIRIIETRIWGTVFMIPDIGYRVLGVLGLVLLSPGPGPWLKLRYSWSFISRITFPAYGTGVKTSLVFHLDLWMNLFVVPAINTTINYRSLVVRILWIILSIVPSHNFF